MWMGLRSDEWRICGIRWRRLNNKRSNRTTLILTFEISPDVLQEAVTETVTFSSQLSIRLLIICSLIVWLTWNCDFSLTVSVVRWRRGVLLSEDYFQRFFFMSASRQMYAEILRRICLALKNDGNSTFVRDAFRSDHIQITLQALIWSGNWRRSWNCKCREGVHFVIWTGTRRSEW